MSMIQEGSVVSLKSGGPTMTVSSRLSQGMCVCHWFVGDTIQEFTFNESELTDAKYTNNTLDTSAGIVSQVQSSYGPDVQATDATQPVESYTDAAYDEDKAPANEGVPLAAAVDSSMASFPQTDDNSGMADSVVAEAQKISGASGS